MRRQKNNKKYQCTDCSIERICMLHKSGSERFNANHNGATISATMIQEIQFRACSVLSLHKKKPIFDRTPGRFLQFIFFAVIASMRIPLRAIKENQSVSIKMTFASECNCDID